MSRMFCTLREAAETLDASEDQIRTLLEKGILHEFRDGPHRLLKEADVGVLASIQERRATTQTGAPEPASSSPTPPKARRAAPGARPPESRATDDNKQRPQDREARTEDRGQGPEGRERKAEDNVLRRPSSVRREPSWAACRPSVENRPFLASPRVSVRQWFWMGLVQDRPLVIALLSGLVLLGLAALAAGLCFVAQT